MRGLLLDWLLIGSGDLRAQRKLERAAEVLDRRFCVEPGETHATIAARWGLARERSRQLEVYGLRRLRHPARRALVLAEPRCPERLLRAVCGE